MGSPTCDAVGSTTRLTILTGFTGSRTSEESRTMTALNSTSPQLRRGKHGMSWYVLVEFDFSKPETPWNTIDIHWSMRATGCCLSYNCFYSCAYGGPKSKNCELHMKLPKLQDSGHRDMFEAHHEKMMWTKWPSSCNTCLSWWHHPSHPWFFCTRILSFCDLGDVPGLSHLSRLVSRRNEQLCKWTTPAQVGYLGMLGQLITNFFASKSVGFIIANSSSHWGGWRLNK